MTASVSKPAATARAFVGPGGDLGYSIRDQPAHRIVAAVRAVPALRGRCRCNRAEDRGNALADEAHIEVPLVVQVKGANAGGNGVARQFGVGRRPLGIDRPPGFKIAADGIEHRYRRSGVLRHFHAIVQRNDTDTFLDQAIECRQVLVDQV